MSGTTYQVEGLSQAIAALQKRQKLIDRNEAKALRAAAAPLAAAMRQLAPTDRSARSVRAMKKAGLKTPGRLRNSVRVRVYSDALGKRVRVKPESPVAHLVIRGTRPHIEAARNARVMQLKDGGYYRVVSNPGVRHKQPFVDRAVEMTRSSMKAVYTREEFSG